MAYNIRYFIAYQRKEGSKGNTYIHILEKDTSVGTYQTLQADGNPLVITFDGDVNDLYCGTVGSGAEINLRVKPLTMNHLFTTDPQKFMVKVFDGANLMWQGFINTGIYYEDLNTNDKVLLSLKANDGMAILDMIPYRPTSTTYYEGVTNIGTVLNNILSKLNISFNDRWGLLDYRVEDYQDNVFLYLEVNQNNYIDENGKVMTCREVLNSIMQSFGVRISFRGDAIYIVDPINMHDVTRGQYFNSGWGEVIQDFPGGYLNIPTDIKWYQSGINSDTISPINELVIDYDPYSFTGVSYDLSDSNNWSVSGTFNGPYGLSPNQYLINNTIQYKNVVTDGSILMQAIKRSDGTDEEYYFKLQKNTHQTTGNPGIARINFPLTCTAKDTNLKLKISADFYCNTRGYDNIYDTSIASGTINYIDTSLGYRIGGGTDASIHWFGVRILSDYTLNGATYSKSNIEEEWFTNHYRFPFSTLCDIYTDGSLNLFVWGQYSTGWYTTTDKNVLVKNVRAEVVNSNGDPIENNGIRYTALKPLATDYIITPNNLRLIHNAGPYGVSKASFRDYNTKLPSTGIYRGLYPGEGTRYPNSFHVAQSFVSQYKLPRKILKGDLNVAGRGINIQNYLIKWNDYFPGKAFFIANGTYYDKNESMSVELIECESTRENITF